MPNVLLDGACTYKTKSGIKAERDLVRNNVERTMH